MAKERKFDWTGGFSLSMHSYTWKEEETGLVIHIPVFDVSKKDVSLKNDIYRGQRNILRIAIPDTVLSDSREFELSLPDKYDLRKAKANVRDGILYIHIPLQEESKPHHIEIT